MTPARRAPAAALALCLAACAPTLPPAELERPVDPRVVAALAIDRHGHRAHVVDEVLYVVGGFAGGGADRGTRDVSRFDRDAARWLPCAPLIRGKAFFGSTVVDGAIVAVGGDAERYEPAANRWEVLVPAGRLPDSHFGAAALGGTVYVLGGFPIERAGFYAIDVARRRVRSVVSPPRFAPGDHFAIVVALGGELHAIGGLDNERFRPTRAHRAFDGDRWRNLPDAPEALDAKFAVYEVVDGALYVFTPAVGLRYDPQTQRWDRRARFPEQRALPASFVWDGQIVVIGGYEPDEPSRVYAYDVARDVWSSPAGE